MEEAFGAIDSARVAVIWIDSQWRRRKIRTIVPHQFLSLRGRMFLLASFNDGPPDSVAKLAVAVAILLSLGLGLAARRIVGGGLLGGFGAALISLVVMAVWGGGLGAGMILVVFGIGGVVCGGAGGIAGLLVQYWMGRRRSGGKSIEGDAGGR